MKKIALIFLCSLFCNENYFSQTSKDALHQHKPLNEQQAFKEFKFENFINEFSLYAKSKGYDYMHDECIRNYYFPQITKLSQTIFSTYIEGNNSSLVYLAIYKKHLIEFKKHLQLFKENEIQLRQSFMQIKKAELTTRNFKSNNGNQVKSPLIACVNQDFEAGNLSGWTTTFQNGSFGGLNSAFVTTPGSDQAVLAISKVFSGGFSACIDVLGMGDNLDWREISQTFLVTNANKHFVFYVAVIIDAGGHACINNSHFSASITDGAGNVIPCSSISILGQDVSGINCSSFAGINTNGLYSFFQWTPVIVPLDTYVGQNITVSYRVTRCNNGGGHGARAYLESSCSSAALQTTGNLMCQNVLNAPNGQNYLYNWYNSTGNVGNSYSVSVAQAGVYTVTMSLTSNPACKMVLDTNVSSVLYPVITISGATTTCVGAQVGLTASGANTYTWSNGATTDTITDLPNSTSTYTVTGTGGGNCVGTATAQAIVNPRPIVIVSVSSSSVCEGTSAKIMASGANTYSWNTGGTTSTISVTPSVNTSYTVIGTDLNNCSNSQTVAVTVDNTCQDLWPGDANSDGIADNLDVLELGLHYTQTGAQRTIISNNWQSYHATNWIGTITNGANLNHSDCNGDGTINDNDTLAIFNNYNLTHAFKPTAITTTSAQISLVPNQALVAKGTWGTSSVYLGDATTTINTINGVAFTVNYDNSLLETDSVWIEYPASFINAINQNLKFRKRDFSNGKLYTATTHTINGNVNGYGKIAILHYKIKSSLTTDNVLNLSISQANQSNAGGVITPLTAGSATLMAIGASVGLNELINGNYISLHPNPTNGALIINSTTELQKVEVMAITGQLLMSEIPLSTNHVLHLDHLANGVYFVNLYQNNRIVKREKIILNK